MTPGDFDQLQALMASRAGFRLTRDREQLAEHRLGPVARREGYETVEAMLAELWARPVASLGWAVIEALLNGETWFRRDRAPFDTFGREVAPAISRVRPDGLIRVWSAGCSTGQEAYSLSMAGLESGRPVEVVATDLSRRALQKAAAGRYTQFEIQRGLSARSLLRWFEPVDGDWCVREEVRAPMRFVRANLMDEPADGVRFDVIFCRHVLSEVEPSRRARVIELLERRLADDGCLFLGTGEGLESDSVSFQPVVGRPGLYVKSPAALRHAA